MSERSERNPHTTALAERLAREMRGTLREMMLNDADACMVLLAAAHGQAAKAGWTQERLVRAAIEVWDAAEAGRARKVEHADVDYDLENLERKIGI